MNSFKLQDISRVLFVITDEEVYISPPGQRISHGEWFEKQGWSNERNIDFLEMFPRGYIDEEGVYFYQGRKSKEPNMSPESLKRVVKILCQKVNIKDDLHVYFGVDTNSSPNRKGKLPPLRDLGKISDIINA